VSTGGDSQVPRPGLPEQDAEEEEHAETPVMD
jgi:hypothetical protein